MKTRRLLFALALGLGLTLAALAGLGGNLPRARAATYTVTNTNASGPGSLRQAILDANGSTGHDTIDFGITGTIVLTDALPAIVDDLTIAGPGAEQLAVSGAHAYRVFAIDSGAAVTITGVTVRDGSSGIGGGVYIGYGSATLNGTRVVSNSAGSGGGVYVDQGSATLSGTQVVSNSAGFAGGGVFINMSSATLNVSEGVINSNSAADMGGGVFILMGSATLSRTQVTSNSAGFDGGGVCIFMPSATLNMSEGALNSNSADVGGGMYVSLGSATLSRTQVVSNSANDGGGIWNAGDLHLNAAHILGNSAVNGGGVFIEYSSAALSGTQVTSNSASYGGGVYVNQNSATLSMRGGAISNNSGSGVYINEGSATMDGAQVIHNSAVNGGGVYIDQGSATLTETQVVSNSANDGGGVYINQGSATLNVNRGTINSNSASWYGGGMYVDDGRATLSGTQVASNAAYVGGGVYVDQGSATLTETTQVVSNTANRGGGVFVDEGSATLDHAHVLNNSADHGGGLYQKGGSIIATDGCIVNNSDTSVIRSGGSTLVATENWWGTADGPSGAGPGSGDSVSTGVDYSGFLTTPLPCCPTLPPDLVIVKAVTPTVAMPGQAITYTLAFHNAGLHIATGVVITDVIPVSITHSSLNVDSNIAITATGSISYVWEVGDLAPGAGGIITITGVLSDPLAAGTFANTATVASAEIDADSTDNSSSAWLTFNQAPTANAGSDQGVGTGAIAILNGSGSSDPDGHLPLTYGWTQTGGPAVTLSDPVAISPTFTAPSYPTVLTFTLAVTDSLGLPDPTPDEVVITVEGYRIYLPLVMRQDESSAAQAGFASKVKEPWLIPSVGSPLLLGLALWRKRQSKELA